MDQDRNIYIVVDKVGAPYRVLLYQPGIRFIHLSNSKGLCLQHLGGHIDAGLWFALATINDFLNLIDFLILQLRKHFLDFESVHNNIRVLRFRRSLSIRLLL